jgi:endonuclease YncB( thermonuclease family)
MWPAAKAPPAIAPAAPAEVAQMVEPAARDVTPPGIVPGPAVEGPLARLEVPPPLPPPPRWHRFFRPLIVEAGLFEAKGKFIRLRGIEPLPADAQCIDGDGMEWPCGRTALMELRRLVRGRAIECNFSSGATDNPLLVFCRVATTDLALWLADRGWARPEADAPPEIRAAANAAHCAGRGVWRDYAATGPCR